MKNKINIESLEINLVKASEINDKDVVIVKVNNEDKLKLTKEEVHQIYSDIKKITRKDVSIYFFPKNLDLFLIKKHIENVEKEKLITR